MPPLHELELRVISPNFEIRKISRYKDVLNFAFEAVKWYEFPKVL